MIRVRLVAMSMLLFLPGACSDDDGQSASTVTTAMSTTTGGPTTTTTGEFGEARVVDLSGLDLQPLTMLSDGQSVWLAGSGAPEHGRVVRIDTEAGSVAWSVAVPDSIVGLAIDNTNGVLWATGGGDGADPDGGITRLDGASGKVLGTLEVPGGSPYGVAVGPQAVWVTDVSSDRVWKVDRVEGTIAATIHVEKTAVAIAFGNAGDTLWVASLGSGVTRLDATTGALRGTVPVSTANSVVANPGAVWVGGEQLVRLDPATGKRVAAIPTRGVTAVRGISNGWVWGKEVDGGVVRGDVEGLRLESQPVTTGEFAAVAVAGDSAWVYDPGRKRVVEKRLPLVSDLDFPVERPHEGDNVGYIRNFGDGSLAFDPIESLVNPRATEVAVLDGVGISAEEGIPNDYYDRNRDGRTYNLPLRSDAKFLVIKSGGEMFPSEVDRATFKRALSATGVGEFYGAPGVAPFRLMIEGGQGVRAEQMYRP